MKGIVTINTDAGFYPIEQIGAYAYWIKADGLFLRGSGVFKDKCSNSTEAEKKAIINALHILYVSKYKVQKLIFNRDNIYAKAGKKGDKLQQQMTDIIKKIKHQSITRRHQNYHGVYAEFRHVKAHLHTNTPKHWVNDWCDKQCKIQLEKYRTQVISQTK